VGGQKLMISGNKVKIKVDIATYKCHQFKNFIYWMLNQWLGVLLVNGICHWSEKILEILLD